MLKETKFLTLYFTLKEKNKHNELIQTNLLKA